MKVAYKLNREVRSIELQPEDELEVSVLAEIHKRVTMGSRLHVTSINQEGGITVELKVNG
jgi:hypothetical protein